MTKVSVVLCCYNDGEVIKSAVRSVLNQSGEIAYELLIVDDGSDEVTAGVVDSFADHPRVRIVRNETNQGLVASANRGLDAADGEYVVRLDADDALAPSALRKLLTAARDNEAGLVHADRYEVDKDWGTVSYVSTAPPLMYFRLLPLVPCSGEILHLPSMAIATSSGRSMIFIFGISRRVISPLFTSPTRYVCTSSTARA